MAAVAATGASGGAVPLAHASATTTERSLTLRLWAEEQIGAPQLNDVPPAGLSDGDTSKGDTVGLTNVLRNAISQFGKPAGARVGTISAVFTFVDAKKARVKAVAKLPGGTLRITTRRPEPPRQTITVFEVTGGTGLFAGARGTMTARYLAPKGVQHIYSLRLP